MKHLLIYQNNIKLCLDRLLQCKTIIDKFSEKDVQNNLEGVGWYYCVNGIYMKKIGKLDVAYENLTKCIPFFEKLKYEYYLSTIYGYIGNIFDSKGKLDEAEKYYNLELDIAKEANEYSRLARSTQNLASIFWKKNELKMSLDYYKKSLELLYKAENMLYVTEALYYIVRLLIDLGNEKESQHYINQLYEHSKTLKDRDSVTRYTLADAYLKKQSKRIITKAKAQEIFHAIAHDEIIDHEMTFFAILNLLDLLFHELKAYGEEEVLNEIIKHINKMYDQSKQQGIFSKIIESLILKSKLAMFQGNLEDASDLLELAVIKSKEIGLTRLHIQAMEEKALMNKDFIELKEFMDKNPMMSARIERVNFIEYIRKAQKLVQDPEIST